MVRPAVQRECAEDQAAESRVTETHLTAIRERDASSAATWFKPSRDHHACARAIQDRRYLLAELDRVQAENDKLRDEGVKLRERLASLRPTNMPEGARATMCGECGWMFHTHAPHYSQQR
jgi:hypothetical protein